MKEFAAILLAGGKSVRMGQDKAGLKIGDRTLLERTLQVLRPVASKTVVMLNSRQKIPDISAEFRDRAVVGRDSRSQQGPLQGIIDALPLLPPEAEYIYVVTCDLPYLTSDWLKTMRHSLDSTVDVVHAVDEAITNPLLALYRKRVLLRAPQILASKHRRPIKLWDGQRLVGIIPPENSPLVCKDINTPEDLKRARDYFSDTNRTNRAPIPKKR
ncbi:MAG: molybdenum cofactor guanylyltransferase [Proteobacteria bacterium]|nr:molybdenum cofactor guanylyltransferase [Pseudomonadota bacterium]